MMRAQILVGILLIGLCRATPADSYQTGAPHTPYPPGCATLPLRQLELYDNDVAVVYSARVWLEVVQKVQSPDPLANRGQVDLTLYRVGCAEPGRSVILVEFRMPEGWADPRKSTFVLPTVGGDGTPMHLVPLQLRAEPNTRDPGIEQNSLTRRSFGDYSNGWDDPHRFTWRYVLDIGPEGQYWAPGFLTEYYNGSFPLFAGFQLVLMPNQLIIDVPATADLLPETPAALPLSGRQSGIWVIEGAADQGFQLAISEQVGERSDSRLEAPDLPLVIFFSQATYDAAGNMLWLTGAAAFEPGAEVVTIPVDRVSNGEFRGRKQADRERVGSVTITSRSCDELGFDFDYSRIGLGRGEARLQRLFSLETAGHDCRDYEARVAANR